MEVPEVSSPDNGLKGDINHLGEQRNEVKQKTRSEITLLQREHKIQKNDNLTKIAKKFGVDLDEIASFNNIKDKNVIIIGKTLSIPDSNTPHKELESTTKYTIQKNDTLTKIAEKFGVDLDEIASFNNIKDKNVIIAGKTLSIPSQISGAVSSIKIQNSQGVQSIEAIPNTKRVQSIEAIPNTKRIQSIEAIPNTKRVQSIEAKHPAIIEVMDGNAENHPAVINVMEDGNAENHPAVINVMEDGNAENHPAVINVMEDGNAENHPAVINVMNGNAGYPVTIKAMK